MFVLGQIGEKNNSNIYLIMDDSEKDCVPFRVFGYLRVEGESYANSNVSYSRIADEARPYLPQLVDLAKSTFFQVD